MANKKNLCGLGVHSPSLFGPGRKNKPHISIFQPFLLFSFTLPHWSYLREQGQKERGERARGVDGERGRDIDITFIESPFTLPLLSLEKVRTRISSPLWDSLFAPLYPPPVAPLYKKKKKQDFSASAPISTLVVYAHSVLAFTMNPSFPSPPIYCDLAPLNDGAYTCLQD